MANTNMEPKFEVLSHPKKSFSDKKDYKVIRLENGLTACLISDLPKLLNEVESTCDAFITNFDANEDEVKLAAAALCINVGSFTDPKEVPGLAHLLEHMVSMGSEKFPRENDFSAFIAQNGGSDNAATDYEVTTFHFECLEKHLFEAMDRFSQFFITPLMQKESMAREREAVESEFQMVIACDAYRKQQLLLSLGKDPPPVNFFPWGNLVTLRDNISDDQLYEKLHEFRRRHYSAHRMTLAVQARLPMDILESYVVTCFFPIPNNSLPPKSFKQYSEDILDTPNFKRLYYVKPVSDICQVDLSWTMPSYKHMYKSKPYMYVSWLLDHEGKGSLLSYLKKKLWAVSLSVGCGESGADFNSIYTLFHIYITLTKNGFSHLEEVISAVFSYLRLLKELGPQERIFREIQRIKEISFRFSEDETAREKVEVLAENMQIYPPQDYLTGPVVLVEYNPEEITIVLSHLVPDRMNIMVLSSDMPDTFAYDKTEQWFKTKYTAKDIPSDWLRSWLAAKPLSDFELPPPNPFLTEDFSLLPVEENLSKYPEKILNTSLVELWYRKDQKFELPMAYYYYYFIYPESMESAEKACMNLMFVIFLQMNLTEEIYSAPLAKLLYYIFASERGISLRVVGFNEKLPVLLEKIAKHLKTVSSKLTVEAFEAVKEKQIKSFYNAFLTPANFCNDLGMSIVREKYFTFLQKHAAISGITFDMMKDFSENIFKNMYIQGLVQGNVSADVALHTMEHLLEQLNCLPLAPQQFPKVLIKEIPREEHCCRTRSFNITNPNSIITNHYQCGLMNIKGSVILELIFLLIEEPLFDILRTKEQLGYNVYCRMHNMYGVMGYTITVNTRADKHTVQHVNSRIEAFLQHTRQILTELSVEKFNESKNNLIKMKQHADIHLEDEVNRNWAEIVNLTYSYDRDVQQIQALEELKLEEVIDWWNERNMNGNSFRKISTQIIGHVIKEETTTVESKTRELTLNNKLEDIATSRDNSNSSKKAFCNAEVAYRLELFKDNNEIDESNKEKDYFITDIDGFKTQLNSYLDTPEAQFGLV